MRTECARCQVEREKRARVIPRQGEDAAEKRRLDRIKEDAKKEPFVEAPAIYAYNVPKWSTLLLRSREYAKQTRQCLCWSFAHDVPLFSDDRELPERDLHKKRCNWLQRHDQDTCHLTSMLPLVKNLPVRLTDTINRNKKLYRGRRGRIVGWQLHPDTEKVYNDDGECMLSRQPVTIFVQFKGAEWRIKDLEKGVYPVTQASRTWLVNKATRIQARRTGFFLVPDFSSTAHMIQGQTLPAVFADAQRLPEADDGDKQSNRSRQISAYISFSRVRKLNTIWVLQPFALSLFQQGPPPGPAILLDRLLGKRQESIEEAFARYDSAHPEEERKKKGGAMSDVYQCRQCREEGRKYMLSPIAFGADECSQILDKIPREGAWARC